MTTTTIRVPRTLHERLNRQAHTEGTTLAKVIERALNDHDRVMFEARVRATMTTPEARADLAAEAALFETPSVTG